MALARGYRWRAMDASTGSSFVLELSPLPKIQSVMLKIHARLIIPKLYGICS